MPAGGTGCSGCPTSWLPGSTLRRERACAPTSSRGVLARSLAAQPVLCDLLGAQAAVLERNVSPQVAAAFKRAAVANARALAGLVRARLAELGEESSIQFVGVAALSAGAVWAHTHPSAAMQAAYEADPELAALRLDFTPALRELLAGLLARRPSPSAA